MTETEKQAIERLNNFKSIKVLYGKIYAMHTEQLEQLQKDIETAINLIEKQQSEMFKLQAKADRLKVARDNWKKTFYQAKAEIENKDKIIDEMAKYWQSGISYCEDCDRIIEDYDSQRCETCIKEYFKKKVENK